MPDPKPTNKKNEVLNFQEYWKAYGYQADNSEMSARRAFTFAQLQTHRQYLSLQREVEKLRALQGVRMACYDK